MAKSESVRLAKKKFLKSKWSRNNKTEKFRHRNRVRDKLCLERYKRQVKHISSNTDPGKPNHDDFESDFLNNLVVPAKKALEISKSCNIGDGSAFQDPENNEVQCEKERMDKQKGKFLKNVPNIFKKSIKKAVERQVMAEQEKVKQIQAKKDKKLKEREMRRDRYQMKTLVNSNTESRQPRLNQIIKRIVSKIAL